MAPTTRVAAFLPAPCLPARHQWRPVRTPPPPRPAARAAAAPPEGAAPPAGAAPRPPGAPLSRRSLLTTALPVAAAATAAAAAVTGGLPRPPPAAAAAAATRVADPAATERTTPSGVRLVDFAIGSGAPVGDGDTVSIDYTTGTTAARYGWKIDSTEVGWAGGPGRPPLVFTVGRGQVIRGLEEAVTGMRPGGKRRAVIPPAVGYVGGRGEPVPPGFEERQRWKNLYANSARAYVPDLIFDVQVVRVKPGGGGGGDAP